MEYISEKMAHGEIYNSHLIRMTQVLPMCWQFVANTAKSIMFSFKYSVIIIVEWNFES